MSSRSTNNEVLVIIGVGGMGVSVARRSGAGRTIVLADINADGLNAAAGALTEDGHQKVEELMAETGLLREGESLYDATNIRLMHHLNAALRAHAL